MFEPYLRGVSFVCHFPAFIFILCCKGVIQFVTCAYINTQSTVVDPMNLNVTFAIVLKNSLAIGASSCIEHLWPNNQPSFTVT